MPVFIHSHIENESSSLFREIFDEIILHGVLDTLKIIPFLFLTYLFMEWLEHKGTSTLIGTLRRSGRAGPLIGGALGAIPQCGFSATGAGLFSARIISAGTLVAIFLSTSDEMLPILISGRLAFWKIAIIIFYKVAVGILVGLLLDFLLRVFKKQDEHAHIHELCEDANCHCERGILYSSIHHTLTVGLFLLVVTLGINTLVYFVGDEILKNSVFSVPFISHILSALIGLIPNCAVSVALANFYIDGYISAGTMLSGLFSGAGVGLIVLFKTNKSLKQNLSLIGLLILCGLVFGMIFDLFPI